MNNYFFCDNNEKTIEFLMANEFDDHIDPAERDSIYLMCFFIESGRNHIFGFGQCTPNHSYVGNGIDFFHKHTLLSSLGMSLQEIIDTCKESSNVVNS